MGTRNTRLLRVSSSVATLCWAAVWAVLLSVQLQPRQPVVQDAQAQAGLEECPSPGAHLSTWVMGRSSPAQVCRRQGTVMDRCMGRCGWIQAGMNTRGQVWGKCEQIWAHASRNLSRFMSRCEQTRDSTD